MAKPVATAIGGFKQFTDLVKNFTWYSSLAEAVMTKKILGSYQGQTTNSFNMGEFGGDDLSDEKLFFCADITDGSGYSIEPGDILYELGTCEMYLGSYGKLKHDFIYPGTLVVKNTEKTTTYTENVDYTVDYERGLITKMTPTVGAGITDSVNRNFNWYDGKTLSDVEYSTSTGYLTLEDTAGVYDTSGYWLSYPAQKHVTLSWYQLTVDYSVPANTTLVMKIFDGTATNAEMIADTDVLYTWTQNTAASGTKTIALSSVSGIGESIRIKVTFTTTNTASTPYIVLSGSGALDLTTTGAKLYCTYQHNRHVVMPMQEPGMDYHMLRLKRA